MGLFDFIKGKSSGTPSLEEVRREEKRLEIREERTLKKLEQLDREREKLFSKGAEQASSVRRRQMARLYNQRTQQIQMAERDLNLLSKQMITINAIKMALERKEQMEQRGGLANILAGMNEAELATILEDDKIGYEMYVDRLNQVIGTLNESQQDLTSDLGKEGVEVLNIWERMDEGQFDSFETALKEADQTVRENMKERDLLSE